MREGGGGGSAEHQHLCGPGLRLGRRPERIVFRRLFPPFSENYAQSLTSDPLQRNIISQEQQNPQRGPITQQALPPFPERGADATHVHTLPGLKSAQLLRKFRWRFLKRNEFFPPYALISPCKKSRCGGGRVSSSALVGVFDRNFGSTDLHTCSTRLRLLFDPSSSGISTK